jgi:hypothetical protein
MPRPKEYVQLATVPMWMCTQRNTWHLYFMGGMSFIQCPQPGCIAPAEIVDRYRLGSTGGPVEHVKTMCLHGHWFLIPTEPQPVTVAFPLRRAA